MSIAGHTAVLYSTGTATSITNEATTLVSGKTFQITNRARRLLDPTAAITVKDDAVTVAGANILSFDLLNGIVTFTGGYTVNGSITIDGDFLPLVEVTTCKSFTFSSIGNYEEDTVFNNGGFKTRVSTIDDYSLQLGLHDDVSPLFRTELDAGTPVFFIFGPGFDPASADGAQIRARVLLESEEEGGEASSLLQSSYTAQGAATTSVDGYEVGYVFTSS